ncbi:glycosyl transferase [Globomyces pollinis-pini]|nr:glycosyl transferase [Globomyces pollinis-pini]
MASHTKKEPEKDNLITIATVLYFILAAVKSLWIPTYHSTDFEVHRNWLAITHSLPLVDWYYENTSEWTLDYPPFFAYFEFLLSQIAQYFDEKMLNVQLLNYKSESTIVFQRLSVIVTELIYYFGTIYLLKSIKTMGHDMKIAVLFIVLATPGLMFVDHIHFQYNAVLYGIQIASIGAFFNNQHIFGGILFAIVLNFKHIYLYQAPAYFIYLLGSYCFVKDGFSFFNFLKLGISVLLVFAISLGPFLFHIPQLLSRLFPFKRGLCHAYWAPNFWALYSFLDRILLFAYKWAGVTVIENSNHGTRGLVGDSYFSVLYNIPPYVTLLLTVGSQLPILWKLWKYPNPKTFLYAVILCGFGSFNFGWHVHEKAILLVLVPFGFLALESPSHAKCFYILSLAGTFALFPLIFEKNELITKNCVLIFYLTFIDILFIRVGLKLKWKTIELFFIYGFILLNVYSDCIHWMIFGTSYEFLPLMFTSGILV